jgi:acetylornithine deacetylase/succinyl-diaminopimelate desuccinylase-like protein
MDHDRWLAELSEFLRIPSISTLPAHDADCRRAAEWVARDLRRLGCREVSFLGSETHPVVWGVGPEVPGAPTLLIYGHYDVQPPDPLNEWTTPPFEPSVRDGSIYARGSADDKGQMYMHVKAVETLRAVNGTLPVNLKFLIEGEEEVGGGSIASYVAEHASKLKADVALVSDTALYAPGIPTLCIGLRGLVYLEVEAIGPSRDLHSGLYGGAAPNAVFGLIELLAKAKNSRGEIKIPGIYDDVEPPAPAEKESWAHLPFKERDFLRNEVGSTKLVGETKYSVLERIWARPTFEVHGVGGGFTGVGSKTVIPSKATAKVSIRLVPRQDPDKIIAAFRQFVKKHAPRGIKLDVRVLASSPGLVVNPDHPAIQIAARAFSDILQKPTVLIRSGGSIPIVGDFATHLGIPTILMGFGLPDDGLHSPNEKYSLDNYYKGIMTIAHFFEEYGR